MKGSVMLILAMLVLNVHQNEGFRIHEGVKELINGTTTTTATELPINDEVIEGVSHAPENSRPQGFSSSSSFKTTEKSIIEPRVSRCGPGERLTHSGRCILIPK
uniref:Uncharacterized protein n=1 Tax=Homalodisca liturata TaxID=320908 RepID=A0A1B6JVU1_9HEMI